MSAAGNELALYLNMLFGAEPGGSLIELRYRDKPGWGRRWFSFDARKDAAGWIGSFGRQTDTYVGVAPRVPTTLNGKQSGGRDAVKRAYVLWADCDTSQAIERLDHFRPMPSMIVRSGTGRHAYWSLWPPGSPEEIEKANRRLARVLFADRKTCDIARVLRPPGTYNYKGPRRVPVTIEAWSPNVYTVAKVVVGLPEGETSKPRRHAPRDPTGLSLSASELALRAVEPLDYVEILSNVAVGRDRKIPCPFPDHDDRTPSLHIYEDAEQGWFCYGCERGGDVYNFAACLWGLDVEGDFVEIRRRVRREFGMAEAT